MPRHRIGKRKYLCCFFVFFLLFHVYVVVVHLGKPKSVHTLYQKEEEEE